MGYLDITNAEHWLKVPLPWSPRSPSALSAPPEAMHHQKDAQVAHTAVSATVAAVYTDAQEYLPAGDGDDQEYFSAGDAARLTARPTAIDSDTESNGGVGSESPIAEDVFLRSPRVIMAELLRRRGGCEEESHGRVCRCGESNGGVDSESPIVVEDVALTSDESLMTSRSRSKSRSRARRRSQAASVAVASATAVSAKPSVAMFDRYDGRRDWELRKASFSPIKECLSVGYSVHDHAEHVARAIRVRAQQWPGNDRTALDAYYIGVSSRTPHERWYMETQAPHCRTWRNMVVLVKSTATLCREVESAAIAQHLGRDRLCKNHRAGGGGMASGSHDAFVYICVGLVWQPAAPLLRGP